MNQTVVCITLCKSYKIMLYKTHYVAIKLFKYIIWINANTVLSSVGYKKNKLTIRYVSMFQFQDIIGMKIPLLCMRYKIHYTCVLSMHASNTITFIHIFEKISTDHFKIWKTINFCITKNTFVKLRFVVFSI